MTVSSDQNTRMLTALVQLRGALQGARLPLDVAGAADLRPALQQTITQLEDYVIPRQTSTEAPLLVVVGGSTGAGKSTLVNSLVGHRVTEAGMLRPTTRCPVLVHHPADRHWFGQDRLLPELVRVEHATSDHRSLQLVSSETVPPGLALLDAPDIDSVEAANREMAAQLLAVADLWLFVTSAARYADQVPWEHLKRAAERSTAVAVVLDRTAAESVPTVAAHLARMLASRGLKDSPLFTVPETTVAEDGLLPTSQVADIRGWLTSLARDTSARSAVVQQTLDGTIRTLSRRSYVFADAFELQVQAAEALRAAATSTYDDAGEQLLAQLGDGTLLRGEVLARWQELSGTGDLLRSLDRPVGWLRGRVSGAVRGAPQQAERVNLAVESALENFVLDHAESAAARVRTAWEESDAGRGLVAADDSVGRAASDLRRRTEAEARAWQEEMQAMIRAEGADKATSVRFLAYGATGLGVALAVSVFARRMPATHDPATPGGAAALGRTLLDAVLGEAAVDALVERAGASLDQRLGSLLEGERTQLVDMIDGLQLRPEAVSEVRAATRRLDDRRFEQQSIGRADTLS
jgi:hypothetical protein